MAIMSRSMSMSTASWRLDGGGYGAQKNRPDAAPTHHQRGQTAARDIRTHILFAEALSCGRKQMVRNVRPGSIRDRSSGGSAARDPFDALLARATQVGGIRAVPADDTGSTTAENVVEAGEPVRFRCPLPAGTGPAQALLFERDAAGSVTLLSHSILLGGDVWYRDEVVVPREDALIGTAGPSGRIRLTVPGTSTLLLVCCRERRIRFDKLRLFENTVVWQQPGSVAHGPVSREKLDELYHLLAPLPSESWIVLTGTIVVRPSSQPAKPLLPQMHPAAKLPPRRADSGPTTAAPRFREAPAMNDTSRNLQISDEVKARLRLQTPLLHRLAQSLEAYQDSNRDAPVGRFKRRIGYLAGQYVDHVNEKRFFLGGIACGQDQIPPIQAELAYLVHRLCYDDQQKQTRWVVTAAEPQNFDQRGKGYLTRLWQNDAHYPPQRGDVVRQKSVPKVDMALIAHCFQTPVQIWEAWDDELFDFWVTRIKQGINLFEYEAVDYLIDYATVNNDLNHFPCGDARPLVELINLPTIPANVRLGFHWNLPTDFTPAEAMLFEFDHTERQLSLISTYGNTGGDLVFQAEFRTPRVAGGGTTFGPSQQSDLLMLLVRPGALERNYHGVSSLKELGFYVASGLQTFHCLTADQIERLRAMLFRLPLRDWRLFKKTF
jgi:hypothetical protein